MLSPTLKRVQIARTALLLDNPFFGVLALQLKTLEDPTCDTAWTNGSTIAFSPAFVDTLSNDELTGLLAHEVMHCACGHPWRRDSRDARKWNQAADYAINGILTDAGFKLPANGLHDAQYNGRSAEWIFDRLPDEPPDNGNGKGNDPGGMGEVRDAEQPSADNPDAPTESDWQQNTQQALNAAKARGALPESLARDLAEVTEPVVDWRSLLRRYVQEIVRADYSWTLPNRRYIACGLYLPALHSIACGRIVVAIDTSGSIDQVLLSQFTSELRSIVAELEPSSVDVVYCDSRIHKIDTFDRGEPLEIACKGGGGTAFEPVFEHYADDPPAVLVYFTDLDGSFPSDAPEHPTIWAVAGRGARRASVPFGDVVPLE